MPGLRPYNSSEIEGGLRGCIWTEGKEEENKGNEVFILNNPRDFRGGRRCSTYFLEILYTWKEGDLAARGASGSGGRGGEGTAEVGKILMLMEKGAGEVKRGKWR